ncbi:MAG: hypothetical protein Q4G51_05680 [Dermatophilus congolensis]|nr:hypothetical protein [Dermatophilus congolensis]
MSVLTVPRNSMDAARAPIDESSTSNSTSVILEGALYDDPVTCQRALAALIADELIAVEAWAPVNVIELADSNWAVDVPGAAGGEHGVVIVPRIMGADIDSVRWELLARSANGGPEADSAPLVVEFLGLQPRLVHELLALVRTSA